MVKTNRKPDAETQGNDEVPEVDHEAATLSAEVSGPAPKAAASHAEAIAEERQASASRTPIVTPDPRGVMSISLGDTKGSPRAQLRRSHKYKQMQIRFDEQPDEKYLAMLKDAGWTDRTESEGIFTRQAPPGQWQAVADAERLFKEIANGIRKDKGLEPVMEGLAVA